MSRSLRNVAILAVISLLLFAGAYRFFGATDGSNPPRAGQEKHDDERAVELSDAKITAVGIELAKAGPATLRDSLRLNGIIQPNQEALTQVTPRFPGVVREIRKRIGDPIAKGDLLATVESNQSLTVYELRSPIAGTVIDRQISLGEYASEQKPSFVIADLSSVWIDFSVYRRDISRVRVGDTIVIDPEDGGAPIESKITYVSPVGTSDTQSSIARAVVDNSASRLRPGFFVTGRLMMGAKDVAIAVKASALQTLENRAVIFVRNGSKFEARDVETGDRDRDNVEITFGLMSGDIYAAKNSFIIKAELAKGTAKHEH